MKQSYFNNAEFHKYLLYAMGEMMLVVIGILGALQIDNWNSERIQQETLSNYLKTIARNIGSDLITMNEIRSVRINDYELSIRWQRFESRSSSYSVPEATFAGELIGRASTLRHFNASSSGYEALKSSGTLDQMQGKDIERLLYDYYDTIARIASKEQDHNDLTRLIALQVWAGWPEGLGRWELPSAYALTADRFKSQQAVFRQALQDPTTQQLIENLQSVGPLLLDYDKLDRLGKAFRRMVEIDSMDVDETAITILDGIYSPGSGVGQPNLIVDGQVAWHSHYLISSDANDPRVSNDASAAGLRSPYDFNSFQRNGDSLHIDYHGGVAWAGIWLAADTGVSGRGSRDYSGYDKLVLELKGDAGGEQIIINMEDKDDPADGTSTRYELQLSDRWQTYEIDLAEFATADLSILSASLGFVFFEEPVSFSVRTAKFVKAD